MSVINVTDLTFAYDGSYDNIFENVSFQLDTDWKLGFTGRNGRGKTTFLKLLRGGLEYRGTISASVDFEYFPYDVPDKSVMTVEAVEAICPDTAQWQLYRELSLLSVDDEVLYRPFGTLSNGEQTKVLLAALFLRENSFLLIDEPTNHLDMDGRRTVSEYLRGKQGFILVSHDRAFLDGCIDHILSINKTDIDIQKGNFSSWYINKQRQDSFETAENDRLKKEVRHLKEAAKATADWSDNAERKKVGIDTNKVDVKKGYAPKQAAKAKKMMARSKAIESRQQSAIEEKSKLLKNIESSEELKLNTLPYHANRLVYVEGLSVSYGGRTVCSDVSFTIGRGERVALQGRNGSGKSSILKLICGEDIPHTGTVQVGSQLKISYVPQDTSYLRGDLKDYAVQYGLDESIFKAILRKLDFSRVQFEKDIADFSGGQKKKVLIARSLCESAHLHIWDEPLNFVDVISRIQIEQLILEYKPILLFVEHDSAFIENIATKVVKL